MTGRPLQRDTTLRAFRSTSSAGRAASFLASAGVVIASLASGVPGAAWAASAVTANTSMVEPQGASNETDDQSVEDGTVVASATRGMAGSVEVVIPGDPVRVRPDLDLTSPMLARIEASETDRTGATRYRIEFLGTIPGRFDLATLLVRADGSTVESLASIPVAIVSHLEADAGTDVFVEAVPAPPFRPTYRATMLIVIACWAMLPIVAWLVVRWRRPAPTTESVELESPPTTADRLAAILERAEAGTLDLGERARLELLVYQILDEQRTDDERGHAATRADAVRSWRRDPEIAPLLERIEAWLHRAPPDDAAERPRSALADVLAAWHAHPVAMRSADADASARLTETGERA